MIISEEAKNIFKDTEIYNKLNFNTIVTISGIEVIKNNEILPISTIYLENDDNDIVFIADYCNNIQLSNLTKKLSKKLNINDIHALKFTNNKKQMLLYFAYADPNIRPIIYGEKVIYNNHEIKISENNKITINDQELNFDDFLKKIYGIENKEQKKKVLNEILKKEEQLKIIIDYLQNIKKIIDTPSIVPKMIDVNGRKYKAILYRNQNGKYIANIIKNNKPEICDDFLIDSDLTWDDYIEEIKNFGAYSEDVLLNKIVKNNTHTTNELIY